MFDELFAAWRIRLRGRLTADDELLIKALERELAGVVATRNRLVHDVWMGPLDESQPLSRNGGERMERAHSLSRVPSFRKTCSRRLTASETWAGCSIP